MGETPFGVQRVRGTYPTTRGTELFEQRWEVTGRPKAAVVLVHGYAEHSTRYNRFAGQLNAERFSLYAYDHIGHGESPGRRGYISSFERLPQDLAAYLEWFSPHLADSPLFLMGHSFGALILLYYVLQANPPVNGLVLSSGLFTIDERNAPLAQKMLGFLSALLPNLTVHSIDPAAISRESAEVVRYKKDPFINHRKIQAHTAHDMAKALKAIVPRFGDLALPFIALHGTGDRLALCRGSRRLYEHAASEDKTLKLYEGAYHEILNDLEDEACSADVWSG